MSQSEFGNFCNLFIKIQKWVQVGETTVGDKHQHFQKAAVWTLTHTVCQWNEQNTVHSVFLWIYTMCLSAKTVCYGYGYISLQKALNDMLFKFLFKL